MAQDISSLAEQKTWKLIPVPRNDNVVGYKWIFKVIEEQRLDGSLEA